MFNKMKQFTSIEQTAKLIELGFEKPKGWYIDGVTNNVKLYVNIDQDPMMFNYSIGELIEMLPNYINGNFVNWKIQTTKGDVKWSVGWDCFETEQFQWIRATELIDALYAMIVKLKEEGVI